MFFILFNTCRCLSAATLCPETLLKLYVHEFGFWTLAYVVFIKENMKATYILWRVVGLCRETLRLWCGQDYPAPPTPVSNIQDEVAPQNPSPILIKLSVT
jgi:hypothetical protein